jgi:hypothetical protein
MDDPVGTVVCQAAPGKDLRRERADRVSELALNLIERRGGRGRTILWGESQCHGEYGKIEEPLLFSR